ncbi:hypothetical protein SOCE26_045500 [Sorangium cellulosum]|uniref:Alpha/beta hydrolase n=1 Tax=Sorangium cellulosum TaxID=56 RepID=A0A2L0EV23_SORCE|nr:hypothetical protein [Sorangium cellulosum]AUX43109.1 hypothetical protein SOCE26_045500 [Sorangium cellulosum]
MSDRRTRQLRDALLLAASLVVVGGALLSRRSQEPSASPLPAAASAPFEPSPLPKGGAPPERATLDEHEMQAGCDFADRGFGVYERWRPLPLGKLLVPPARAIGADGGYDLLIHFHGAEPVRKVLAPQGLDLVVAGLDLGTRSSEYARAIDGGGWDTLLQAIDREVGSAAGVAGARARRLVLSSWSAGSGAIGRIVERGSSRVDALILLDSLYGSYMPGQTALVQGQLAPYIALASAAARGTLLFYLTHTETPTSGYASTKEVATFLLRELGASPIAVTSSGDSARAAAPGHGADAPEDALRLTQMYDGGGLFVRGYAGAGPGEHCAQLRLLPAILAEHVLPTFGRGAQ